MLLTITTTHRPATDLGFLLHRHPDRVQRFDVPFGVAHVFYPVAGEERYAAALLLNAARGLDVAALAAAQRARIGHVRPEYADPGQIDRLRGRSLGRKRSLAVREFALGVEGLERFVRREPLHRVHECVFGVLALESEPVDPRL